MASTVPTRTESSDAVRCADMLDGCSWAPDRRLLDDSNRTGVWPDSVQVIGGQLSMRLPTGGFGVAHYRSAARRSP